jgi:DNA polymerase III delta prime subunit
MNFNKLWVEKYRPRTLDNIVLPLETREALEKFRENKDIPHLLFVGTPGNGKTSLAKIIVNDILKCDYLYINASDENGIDTIRHKIIGFAQTKSFDGGIKVVILDESDSLSPESARALRNVMEEYIDNTKFILTANYKHKIIPALQSRCQTLSFNHTIKDVAKHCYNILLKENILINKDQIEKFQNLIKSNFPDFRKTLNELQKYSLSGTLNIQSSLISDEFMTDLYDRLQKEEVFDIRKFIISHEQVFQSDYHNLMKCLLNYLYDKQIDSLKKKEAILIITEYMYRHTFVMDIEINFFACLINLSKLFQTF